MSNDIFFKVLVLDELKVLIKYRKTINLIYCTRAIISHGLYIFYPIFQFGLYCRAVYNSERLIFCDSFNLAFLKTPYKSQEK